jgi:hypothetical protein
MPETLLYGSLRSESVPHPVGKRCISELFFHVSDYLGSSLLCQGELEIENSLSPV